MPKHQSTVSQQGSTINVITGAFERAIIYAYPHRATFRCPLPCPQAPFSVQTSSWARLCDR